MTDGRTDRQRERRIRPTASTTFCRAMCGKKTFTAIFQHIQNRYETTQNDLLAQLRKNEIRTEYSGDAAKIFNSHSSTKSL